jgi:alpha-ribazole phosphatase
MKTVGELYLVRHPAPDGVHGLCYGRLDVTVPESAVASAAESILAQVSLKPHAIPHVYTSPSSRCMGLARRLASPHRPTAAEELLEMSFGRWEGLAWNALPREQIDAWASDVWSYRPGGGESAAMVALRWQRWLSQVQRILDGPVIAVTHAGVIRVALAHAGRLNGVSVLGAAIPFGSVHRLDLA